MFNETQPNCGLWKHASFFTLQVENKQIKASVLWTNDSRIHRNIKIARDDSASESISEQAIILSLEMRPM